MGEVEEFGPTLLRRQVKETSTFEQLSISNFQPVVDAFFETFGSLIEGNTNSAVGGEVALVYISEILFEGSV